jgi:cytidylate kinase
VATDLSWAYLDTGAMYRAVTHEALRRGVALADARGLAALAAGLDLALSPDGTVRVGGEDVTGALRTPEVTAGVSTVAGVEEVRAVMVRHQRRFAWERSRVVAEGRDIGTVVFPDAEVKIYLDADPGERARRRLVQTGASAGHAAGGLAAERARIEERDRRDSTRAVAPLRKAPDAWVLDTTPWTLDEVTGRVLAHVRSVIRPHGPS